MKIIVKLCSHLTDQVLPRPHAPYVPLRNRHGNDGAVEFLIGRLLMDRFDRWGGEQRRSLR